MHCFANLDSSHHMIYLSWLVLFPSTFSGVCFYYSFWGMIWNISQIKEKGLHFQVYHCLLTFIWHIFCWMLNVPIFHFLDRDGRIWNLIYPKICKEDQNICILMLSVFRLKPQVSLWNLCQDLETYNKVWLDSIDIKVNSQCDVKKVLDLTVEAVQK